MFVHFCALSTVKASGELKNDTVDVDYIGNISYVIFTNQPMEFYKSCK